MQIIFTTYVYAQNILHFHDKSQVSIRQHRFIAAKIHVYSEHFYFLY